MKKIVFAILLLVGVVALADQRRDEPHLFNSPNGKVRLELTRSLPRRFRVCAVGKEFTFCAPWTKTKSREVDIEMTIPENTPDGEYHLFYEDDKGRVDLHNVIPVER